MQAKNVQDNRIFPQSAQQPDRALSCFRLSLLDGFTEKVHCAAQLFGRPSAGWDCSERQGISHLGFSLS